LAAAVQEWGWWSGELGWQKWEWRRLAVAVIIAEVVGEQRMEAEDSEESDILVVARFLHW
jgi:hypothetical protein